MDDFNPFNVLMVCLAVVLVIAAIVGGIVFGVRQGTLRQKECVDHAGTYYDGHCFYPQGTTKP